MATIMQTQPSKLLARDIAAFSDAELDRYLETNGGHIQVEDPENVKKDEILLQRLRARAGGQSRPIDLDDLTARLEAASTGRDAPPQRQPTISYWKLVNGRHELVPVKKPANREAPPRDKQWQQWHTGIDENGNRDPHYASRDTTQPLDEEEDYRRYLEDERECYNMLVSEGGRPSHPVSLGRDILENPGEYSEILSYWQRVNHDAEGRVWMVFGSQLGEWRRFCKYQRSARKGDYFLKYPQLVQKRLTRHGFERPFQLVQDLDQQDKLTTWIEFLNYEYQDYDKDMRFVERHQAEYDEAWKELVDSQVLRPYETEEFIIHDPKSAVQQASEEERAEKAVEFAESAVMSAEKANPDPGHAHLSQQATRKHRLVAAQSKLAAAMKSLASIKRRNDLIYRFLKKIKLYQVTSDGTLKQSYVGAKGDAERRSILLRWILQQITLIEIELDQAKVTVNDPDGDNGRKRLKRHPADDLNERDSKRRREDGGNNTLSTHASTVPTASQDPSTQCRDATDEKRTIKRPRHRVQTFNAAGLESLSIQPGTSEPGRTAAPVPKPRKRQAKIYKKERQSRRIVGDPPEFGMLPKRGEPAPQYDPPSRYYSNTRKPNSSSARSHALSRKKSIAVKGAKPQGFRSRDERTRQVKKGVRNDLRAEHILQV